MTKKKTNEIFHCELCPLFYNYRCNLQRHIKKCHVVNGHPCPFCPSTFEKISERQSHLKVHRRSISEQTSSKSSSKKNKVIKSSSEPKLSANVTQKNKTEPIFHCLEVTCTRTFPSEWGRNIHFQRSHNPQQQQRKARYGDDEIENGKEKQARVPAKVVVATTAITAHRPRTNRFIEALKNSSNNNKPVNPSNIVKLVFLPKRTKELKNQFTSLVPIGTGNNLVYQVPEPPDDDDDDDDGGKNNNNARDIVDKSPTNNNNNILKEPPGRQSEDDIVQPTDDTTLVNENKTETLADENKVEENDESKEETDTDMNQNSVDENSVEEATNSTEDSESLDEESIDTEGRDSDSDYVDSDEAQTAIETVIVLKQFSNPKAIYQCTICKQRFTCTTTLKLHVAQHPGEKPWPCDQCWFRFRHQPEVYQHKRWHHVEGGDIKFRCPHCSCTFAKEGVYKRHLKIEQNRLDGGKLTNTIKELTQLKKKKIEPPREPKKRGRKRKILTEQKQTTKSVSGAPQKKKRKKEVKVKVKVQVPVQVQAKGQRKMVTRKSAKLAAQKTKKK